MEVGEAAQAVLEEMASSMGVGEVWNVYRQSDPILELVNLEAGGTGRYIEGVSLRATSCSVVAGGDALRCLTPAGVGAAYQARIIIAGQVSDLLEHDFTYHEPIIKWINSSAIDTRGWTSSTPDYVQVYGAFFGSDESFQSYGDGEVLYGPGFEASCTVYNESFFSFDDTLVQGSRLECAPVAGSGMNHQWTVTTGAQSSEASQNKTRYKAPEILGMDDDQWPFSTTAGGDSITMTGDQMGPLTPSVGHGATTVFALYGSESQFDDGKGFRTVVGSCELLTAHVAVVCTVGAHWGEPLPGIDSEQSIQHSLLRQLEVRVACDNIFSVNISITPSV